MRMPASRKFAVPIGIAAIALVATSCASSTNTPSSEESVAITAGYPVTLQNCQREVSFDAAPEHVVSLWQAPTEMMLALGLGDRLTAVAGNYAPYPESIAEEAAELTSIGDSMSWPSREVVLSEDPDLVLGQALEGFAFDTAQGYASVEQLEESGIDVYGANLCSAEDALNMTLETPSETITDLGAIFDVQDRADEIVAQLAAEKQIVVDAVDELPSTKVAFFNGGDGPLIVLAGGIYDDAIATAGGENVFPADSVYVSKEEFAASDADVILVGTFEGQEFDTLRDYLVSTFPDLPAVQSDQMVEIPVADIDASISVMRGLTQIANAIHPELKLAVPTS